MNDEPTGLSETEISNLTNRFADLGLKNPTGLCLLPRNFLFAGTRSDLFFTPHTPSIKVLLREAGVTVEKIEPDGVKIPFRDDRDSTLIMPVIFLGAAYFAENAALMNVALGVVANYVTDFFRGKAGHNRVKCSVIVETTKTTTTKKIEYDGAPEGFAQLIDAINKTVK